VLGRPAIRITKLRGKLRIAMLPRGHTTLPHLLRRLIPERLVMITDGEKNMP
jgi:hypothetical protein